MAAGRESRPAASRRSSPSRYSWPRWRPSNTPTTTNSRPCEPSSAPVPGTTITAAASVLEDLRRCDPCALTPAHAHDRACLVEEAERHAIRSIPEPGGRPNESALGRVGDLLARERDRGHALETLVRRQEERADAVGAPRRRGIADRVEGSGTVEPKRPAGRSNERPE